MQRRTLTLWAALILTLALGLAACGAPPSSRLPEGPTPIPTLAPATESAAPLEPTPTESFARLSYPARLPSALEGQKIYNASCAQCHGVDGNGVVPAARNFRDLDYMRGEAPAIFYAAVAEGRGDMPSFKDDLSSDGIWDVVFYIWRLATDADTLAKGEQIFLENCAACHGEDGSGQLLGSADFTDLRLMDNLAPRDLYLTITQGRGSMPSWQSRLSQDDRWAVIDYIRTFTYDPALPGEVTAITPAPPTATAAACDLTQNNPLAWDDAAAQQAGQEIFTSTCAACHGQDARGVLPNTPDFTSPAVGADLKANPGSYYCILTDGQGAMPPFGNSLSEEARWQVLTYLGSLAP